MLIGVGISEPYKAQRLAHDVLAKFGRRQTPKPPATVGKSPIREEVVHFIDKKMPGGLPKKTARKLLDIEDANYVPIIREPQRTNAETEAGFYFPGCGSERLFSRVVLTTQAMLWHADVQPIFAARPFVLWLSAARQWHARQSAANYHGQTSVVSPRDQHTELSRFQDRSGELWHLLRQACELRV